MSAKLFKYPINLNLKADCLNNMDNIAHIIRKFYISSWQPVLGFSVNHTKCDTNNI